MELIDVLQNNNKIIKLLKRELKEFIMPKLKYNDKIYLLMLDNTYISMVYFTQNKSIYNINYIHTKQKYRHQGHSLFLIQEVIKNAQKNKCKNIQVTILPESGSDIVFSKLGFTYNTNSNINSNSNSSMILNL